MLSVQNISSLFASFVYDVIADKAHYLNRVVCVCVLFVQEEQGQQK